MSNRVALSFLGGLGLGIVPLAMFGQGTDRLPTPGVTQEILISAPLSQFPGKKITVFTGSFSPSAKTP